MPALRSILHRLNARLRRWLPENPTARSELSQTQARFQALAETLRAVPWEADPQTELHTYVGPQIKALTGYGPEEWTGDLWYSSMYPEDRERTVALYEYNLQHRIDHDLEYRLVTASGEIVWCRDIISFVTDTDGKPLVRGLMISIQDEKMLEQALREGEARYRQAERIAKLGHWNIVFSASGRWEDNVMTYSEAAAMILGTPPGEYAIDNTRYFEQFVHPEDRATYYNDLQSGLARHERELTNTYRIVRPDGTVRWVVEHMESEFDATGKRLVAFGTIQDVTELQENEANLRRAHFEADLANRAKSQFLANMSHELRTPLNAIIGFSEVMKQEIMGPLGSALYKGYCSDIHGSGVHLLSIINDLLDLSVIETGEVKLEESAAEAPVLIESCLVLVRSKAAERRIALTAEIPPGLPIMLVDARRVKQALLNLLVNAIKFTPTGGSVTISANRSDSGLALSVRDTGIGIAPEHREKVLQPFTQVENWLVRKHEGAGLGLPIAKTCAELHGGTLRISDAPHQGTIITVTIPPERLAEVRQSAVG